MMENEVTSALDEHAAAIRKLGKQTIDSAIEIGRRLNEVKELVGYGWPLWLKEEFGWSEKSARNFMNLYEMNKSGNVTVTFPDFSLRSLYLLALPSTPEAVRNQISAKAATGLLKHADVVRELKESGPPAKIGRPKKAVTGTATALIYKAVEANPQGMTADELGAALPNVPSGTFHSSIHALEKRGLLVKTDERRTTRAGYMARVYRSKSGETDKEQEATPEPKAPPITSEPRNNFGTMTEYKPRTWEELGGPPAHLAGQIDPNDPRGRSHLEVHIAKYGRVQLKHTSEIEARWRKDAYAKATNSLHQALALLEKQMQLWDAVDASDRALVNSVPHSTFVKDLAKLEAMVARLAGIREALSGEKAGPRLVSSNG